MRPVPVPEDTDGMIYVSHPHGTVGLVVQDQRVVACPPFAWSWAMGGDAREVWDRAVARGREIQERDPQAGPTVVKWIPGRAG